MMKRITYLTIKLFTPQNESHRTEIMRCPPGTHLEDGPGLDAQMDQFAAMYAKAYPEHEFALRRVGAGQYNVVWITKKPVQKETHESINA